LNLHLIVLVAYSIGLILLGIGIGRFVRTSDKFFVAGRQLSPVLLFATLLAANIGAGSTVGASGLGYRDGVSAWWWVGSAGIGSVVLALWVGPRLWRIAAQHELRTVGDYLELRYGSSVRGIVAALLWLGTVSILAGQLIALAWVLNVVAGVPKAVGCLMGGLVMTIYFAAGGLLTSAWVNMVQLVVLIIGFAVAVPISLSGVGGLDVVFQAGSNVSETYLNFWHGGGSGWTYVALLVPAFIISPGLLQKVYGARDERTVRWGAGLNAAILMVFAAIPPLLGMIARVHHPDLVNHELALPTLLASDLPLLVGALGLAAIFSAEVSSADAILFMLATSLSQDLYRRFLNPDASDALVLKVSRIAAVLGGVLGVTLAIVSPTVIDALVIFYALLSVSLFVPVIAGLYSRKGGAPEAWAAIGAGVTALMVVHLLSDGQGFGIWSPSLVGLIAASLGFFAILRVRRRSGRGETM
jgi:SSS family solute:Na+ symporter